MDRQATGRQTDKQADIYTYNEHTYRQTDRQTDRRTDRQTYTHTIDIQTNKQADIYTYNRHTYRQTDGQTNSLAVPLRSQRIEMQDGNEICKAWSERGAVPARRPARP